MTMRELLSSWQLACEEIIEAVERADGEAVQAAIARRGPILRALVQRTAHEALSTDDALEVATREAEVARRVSELHASLQGKLTHARRAGPAIERYERPY